MNIRWKKDRKNITRVNGLTIQQVADLLETSVQNIYQQIKRHGKDRVSEIVNEAIKKP